jgi:hypothetical protein
MKIGNTAFLLLVCFVLTQCQFIADEVKESFVKVDNSLEESRFTFAQAFEKNYVFIHQNRKDNSSLATSADSIYYSTKEAIHFIDNVKLIIKEADSTGLNINLGESLLINTPTGEQLIENLKHVYQNAYVALSSQQKKDSLDDVASALKLSFQDKDWPKKNFHKNPAFSINVLLSKYRIDCLNTANFSLSDIRSRIEISNSEK